MNNLKPLVNTKDLWESFLAEINQRIDTVYKQMETRTEVEDLYRLQGEVRALRSLTYLRDKVNGPQS